MIGESESCWHPASPHLNALQNRAWAWMGSCCFLCCLPSHPRGGNWFEHLPKLPTPQDRMCTPALVNSIFPGPPWTKAPTSPPSHCLEQNWQGKHLNRHCLHETEMPAGRGEGCTLTPMEQGSSSSLLWSYHSFLSFLLFSHTLHQPHTPFPPLLAGVKATSLGLLPCVTSQSFKQHLEVMFYSPFLPTGLLTCIHVRCLAQHTIPMDLRAVAAPASTHCCSCPLLYSGLDPLQSLARWDLSPPLPPVGSLHGSLHSWPILELLSQCWGCWSLSSGRGCGEHAVPLQCWLQWDKGGRDLKAAFAALSPWVAAGLILRISLLSVTEPVRASYKHPVGSLPVELKPLSACQHNFSASSQTQTSFSLLCGPQICHLQQKHLPLTNLFLGLVLWNKNLKRGVTEMAQRVAIWAVLFPRLLTYGSIPNNINDLLE